MQVRERFNAEHGAYLPEDICLCIGNAPTRWDIVPLAGVTREALPNIEPDLIEEASRISFGRLSLSLMTVTRREIDWMLKVTLSTAFELMQ